MADHEEEEEGRGFRVKDKRRFTAEGDVRADAPEEPEAAKPAPKKQEKRAKPKEGPSQKPPPGKAPRIDFLTFIASLATNALAALGALPKEHSHGVPVNPELAREYIEIIAMLQEKTSGNLTAQEDQGIQRLLTDLRMAYMQTQGKQP